jgi:hypothetical protein
MMDLAAAVDLSCYFGDHGKTQTGQKKERQVWEAPPRVDEGEE